MPELDISTLGPNANAVQQQLMDTNSPLHINNTLKEGVYGERYKVLVTLRFDALIQLTSLDEIERIFHDLDLDLEPIASMHYWHTASHVGHDDIATQYVKCDNPYLKNLLKMSFEGALTSVNDFSELSFTYELCQSDLEVYVLNRAMDLLAEISDLDQLELLYCEEYEVFKPLILEQYQFCVKRWAMRPKTTKDKIRGRLTRCPSELKHVLLRHLL